MDNMIEMKDFQEGATQDDAEMGSGAFEMHQHGLQVSQNDGLEMDLSISGGPAAPGTWLRRRMGKQNRCMVLFMGALVLTAILYVMGIVYMSDDDIDALVQPFDRESGIVGDGMENEKEQQAMDDASSRSSHKPINEHHWGGHQNPFASKTNSVYFPSQGGGGSGGGNGNNFNGGYGAKIGHDGHVGDKRPGKFGHHVNNGNGNGVIGHQDVAVGGKSDNEDNDTGASPQPTSTVVDEADVYCEDLSRYQSWYDAVITKQDGPQFSVVTQVEHDKTAFTQGLTYARGKLFESTGRYGKSTVRILDAVTAEVLHKVPMDNKLFAEGMTYYKDTLVQITWKSQRGFIYNMTNLETIEEYHFSSTRNEGWGITWDRCKDELIMTDGSHYLHFWDPTNMTEKRKVPVIRQSGEKALELNEIEFWRGRVLANVWYEDVLLVIDPETGTVEKEYDFSSLWPAKERMEYGADVFNGISVSNDPDILYVTGKNWDRLFTIELLPKLQ